MIIKCQRLDNEGEVNGRAIIVLPFLTARHL